MHIRQMQYFLKVAETGNFTAAAEDLFISQSSLSKQIIALERELGMTLFDRRGRKIALTPAGAAFRRHAQKINAGYLAMLADLGEHKTSPSFAVFAIPVIAQYGIPTYLTQFRQTHPQLDFTLEEREARLILPALAEHQCDVAFVRNIFLDSHLYAWVVAAHDKLMVAVAHTHPLAGRAAVSLTELADHSFILPAKGTSVHELAVSACRQAGFEPHISYAGLRADSILSMVATGGGVALMMEGMVSAARHPEIVRIPLEETVEGNVVLAWLKAKKLPAPVKTFIEFMGSHLAGRESLQSAG